MRFTQLATEKKTNKLRYQNDQVKIVKASREKLTIMRETQKQSKRKVTGVLKAGNPLKISESHNMQNKKSTQVQKKLTQDTPQILVRVTQCQRLGKNSLGILEKESKLIEVMVGQVGWISLLIIVQDRSANVSTTFSRKVYPRILYPVTMPFKEKGNRHTF